jgi:MFS family permease
LPLALAGDLYNFAERARVQALSAMVWSVSSLAGPLIGGLLVA